MVSGVQTPIAVNWRLTARRLIGFAVICLVSLVSFVMLHEATHLVVGRLLGIPAVFTNPTSIGVSATIAAHTSPTSLALMNGIAPFETVILGVLIFIVLTRQSRHIPNIVVRFFAWWAIFGIPYLGLQMMFIGNPRYVDGSGDDFAALAGYFSLPLWLCALVAFLGLIFFCVSSFWLRAVIATTDSQPFVPQLRPADLPIVPTKWRQYTALLLAVIFIILAVLGAIQIAQGNSSGVTVLSFLCAILLWPIIVAVLVPWRAPGATVVRNNWLLPALLAEVLMMIFGILIKSDYATLGILLPSLLIAPIWMQAATKEYT